MTLMNSTHEVMPVFVASSNAGNDVSSFKKRLAMVGSSPMQELFSKKTRSDGFEDAQGTTIISLNDNEKDEACLAANDRNGVANMLFDLLSVDNSFYIRCRIMPGAETSTYWITGLNQRELPPFFRKMETGELYFGIVPGDVHSFWLEISCVLADGFFQKQIVYASRYI